MNVFLTVMMYVLWTAALIGLLGITFTNFQYPDLDVIVAVLWIFALINTFFTLKKEKN